MTGLLCATLVAGSCFQSQVSHVSYGHVKSYSQAYVAPQVLYFVGQPIRVQSLIEQQKRSDPDYQEFLEFKAWKAGAATQRQSQQQQEKHHGVEGTPPPEPTAGATVRNVCAKCHGKATPAGGFFLDGQYGIEAESVTKAIRMLASGEMPKNRELTKDEKNQVLADLLSLEYQPEETEETQNETD